MLIGKSADIRPSEITSESVYSQRREWLKLAGMGAAGLALSGNSAAQRRYGPHFFYAALCGFRQKREQKNYSAPTQKDDFFLNHV